VLTKTSLEKWKFNYVYRVFFVFNVLAFDNSVCSVCLRHKFISNIFLVMDMQWRTRYYMYHAISDRPTKKRAFVWHDKR